MDLSAPAEKESKHFEELRPSQLHVNSQDQLEALVVVYDRTILEKIQTTEKSRSLMICHYVFEESAPLRLPLFLLPSLKLDITGFASSTVHHLRSK